MEEMAPKGRMRRIATLVACVAGLSCGTGIRDGNDEESVARTIGPEGGQIAFMEGTLDILPTSVDGFAKITLHRYPSIKHAGAIGPVFEIQVPDPRTFNNDPIIEVVTSSEVVNGVGNVMGLLVPGVDQWFPTTTRISSISSDFSCPSSNICGVLQIEEFTSPDGGKNPDITSTKTIQFAIVRHCDSDDACPSQQACNSGACQQCALNGPCNP
jgi:hypothetical protein